MSLPPDEFRVSSLLGVGTFGDLPFQEQMRLRCIESGLIGANDPWPPPGGTIEEVTPPGCRLYPEVWCRETEHPHLGRCFPTLDQNRMALRVIPPDKLINGREKVLRDYEASPDDARHRGKRGLRADPAPFQTRRPTDHLFVKPGEEQ